MRATIAIEVKCVVDGTCLGCLGECEAWCHVYSIALVEDDVGDLLRCQECLDEHPDEDRGP